MTVNVEFCLRPQDIKSEEFFWQKSDGSGEIAIPSSILIIFGRLFEDFHLAEELNDFSFLRNGPFLSFQCFKVHMREIDDLMAEFKCISAAEIDHESLLLLGWHCIPAWARSKAAFEKKWRVRVSSLSSLVSHGYVRGRVSDAWI